MAEDRKGAEIGIKLAILSLARHCGPVPLVLFRPNPLPEFQRWLRKHPHVQLRDEWPEQAQGWDCKPWTMLAVLADHPEAEVAWVDSDIIVSGDARSALTGHPRSTLVISGDAANQPHAGTLSRTQGWGLPVGHGYGTTFYSCVFRMTSQHLPLLHRWQKLLLDRRYLDARKLPLDQQPLHLLSDQDALNALLGSKEFEQLSIQTLVHAKDILHTGGALGFSVSERIRGLWNPPPVFLHAIGSKPWVLLHPEWQGSDLAFRHRRLQQELSEYVVQARAYRDELDEPVEWMDFASPSGRFFRALGLGHWALRGLPVTMAATLAKRLRG